jgi:hypothetical protein
MHIHTPSGENIECSEVLRGHGGFFLLHGETRLALFIGYGLLEEILRLWSEFPPCLDLAITRSIDEK